MPTGRAVSSDGRVLASASGAASGGGGHRCMGGSVVEFSPATREARVRFPAHATPASPFGPALQSQSRARSARSKALKGALLQPLAATCRPLPLPRSCPRPLPPPHTALLPSRCGPKPCGLSRPCAQTPPLWLLASSPGPSRWLTDCAGRHTPPLAAAGPTSSPFPTSVSKLPGSLSPHSETQSPSVCTARSKEVATSGKDTSLFPGGSLEHQLAGGVPQKSTRSRPWAQIGFQQQRPHHLTHHPLP